jgi:hypothetical protein
MQDSNRIDGYYIFIKKGDLVEYSVEGFTMGINHTFTTVEYKFIGVVVSNLIEPLRQISTADITTLGSSIIGSTDNFALPYFKIFCIKQQEIVYIVIDKIKIIKS